MKMGSFDKSQCSHRPHFSLSAFTAFFKACHLVMRVSLNPNSRCEEGEGFTTIFWSGNSPMGGAARDEPDGRRISYKTHSFREKDLYAQ